MKALRDEVIVRVIYKEKVGSIIIPDFKSTKQYVSDFHGEVLSIGPEYPKANGLKIGDKIMFRRHEGKKIFVEGEELLVLKERWVEGVVD